MESNSEVSTFGVPTNQVDWLQCPLHLLESEQNSTHCFCEHVSLDSRKLTSKKLSIILEKMCSELLSILSNAQTVGPVCRKESGSIGWEEKAPRVIATYDFSACLSRALVEEARTVQRWLVQTGSVLLFTMDFLLCLGQVT